jgi:hypothetical protein
MGSFFPNALNDIGGPVLPEVLRLWDAATGKELVSLSVPFRVYHLGFSPDGKVLAAAGDGRGHGEVRLWDVATAKELLRLAGAPSITFCAEFSPDARLLALGSSHGTVEVWDLVAARERVRMKGHPVAVRSLAFTPDGTTLASADFDGRVKLWDATTGQERASLMGEGGITRLVFTPDGQALLALANYVNSPHFTLHVWRRTPGQHSQTRLAVKPVTAWGTTAQAAQLGDSAPAVPSVGWSVITAADPPTYQLWLARLQRTGYRLVFVNGHDIDGRPRLAAVAVKDGRNVGWDAFLDTGPDAYQTRFDAMRARGYWPASVGGFVQGDNPIFASVWLREPRPGRREARHELPASRWQETAGAMQRAGLMPVNVSGYPAEAGHRLTALFQAAPGVEWEQRTVLTAEQLSAVVGESREKGYRPGSIFYAPEAGRVRFGVVLVRGQGPKWEFRTGLTAKEYAETTKRLQAQGYHPQQIVGYPDGTESRFVGVWVRE